MANTYPLWTEGINYFRGAIVQDLYGNIYQASQPNVDSNPRNTMAYGIWANITDAMSAISTVVASNSPVLSPVQQWDTGISYLDGQLIQYQGAIYQATDSHISGLTFNASHWNQLSAAGGGSGYIAGTGIVINGGVISSSAPIYTAGTGININGTTISSSAPIYTAGTGISINNSGVISANIPTYTAGSGILISGTTISATGTGGATYTAGTNINITGTTISLALNKTAITSTGLTYSDVNADQAGAATAAVQAIPVDGSGIVGSLRTLGAGVQQALNKTAADQLYLGVNDASVTNARTPAGAAGGGLSGTFPNPTIATVGAGQTGPLSATDPSVTNARTPTPHVASHATGAADALAPSSIGALVAPVAAPSAGQIPAVTSTNPLVMGWTTAATGSAITAETTRATAAEGLAIQKANNLSDLTNIPAAAATIGLTTYPITRYGAKLDAQRVGRYVLGVINGSMQPLLNGATISNIGWFSNSPLVVSGEIIALSNGVTTQYLLASSGLAAGSTGSITVTNLTGGTAHAVANFDPAHTLYSGVNSDGGQMTIGSNVVTRGGSANPVPTWTAADIGKAISIDNAFFYSTSQITAAKGGVSMANNSNQVTRLDSGTWKNANAIVGNFVTIPGAGSGGTTLSSRVTGYVDSTHITLADVCQAAGGVTGVAFTFGSPTPLGGGASNPLVISGMSGAAVGGLYAAVTVALQDNTPASAGLTTVTNGVLVWGTDNGPAVTAAATAAAANPNGGIVKVGFGMGVCNGGITPYQANSSVFLQGEGKIATRLISTANGGVYGHHMPGGVRDMTFDGANQTHTVLGLSSQYANQQGTTYPLQPLVVGSKNIVALNSGSAPSVWVPGSVIKLSNAGPLLPDGTNTALVSNIVTVGTTTISGTTYPSATIADSIQAYNPTFATMVNAVAGNTNFTTVQTGANNPAIAAGDELVISNGLDAAQSVLVAPGSSLNNSTSGSVSVTNLDGSSPCKAPTNGYSPSTTTYTDITNTGWNQLSLAGLYPNNIEEMIIDNCHAGGVNTAAVAGYSVNITDAAATQGGGAGAMGYPGSAFMLRCVRVNNLSLSEHHSTFQESFNVLGVHTMFVNNMRIHNCNGRICNWWGVDNLHVKGLDIELGADCYIETFNLGWNAGAGGNYVIENVIVTDKCNVGQPIICQSPYIYASNWVLPTNGLVYPSLNVKNNQQQIFFTNSMLGGGISIANLPMGMLKITGGVVAGRKNTDAGCISIGGQNGLTGLISTSGVSWQPGAAAPILNTTAGGTVWQLDMQGGDSGWLNPVSLLAVVGTPPGGTLTTYYIGQTMPTGSTLTQVGVATLQPIQGGDTLSLAVNGGSTTLQSLIATGAAGVTVLNQQQTGFVSVTHVVTSAPISPGVSTILDTAGLGTLTNNGSVTGFGFRDIAGISPYISVGSATTAIPGQHISVTPSSGTPVVITLPSHPVAGMAPIEVELADTGTSGLHSLVIKTPDASLLVYREQSYAGSTGLPLTVYGEIVKAYWDGFEWRIEDLVLPKWNIVSGVTSAMTARSRDLIIVTSGSPAITCPTGALQGASFMVKNTGSGTPTIVAGTGTTIDGGTNLSVPTLNAIEPVFDGNSIWVAT